MPATNIRKVLVIAGPTAAGKSALSMLLAQHLNIEIIGADARQVFTNLNIGTNKPTAQDMQQVKHHCIDIIHPALPYSSFQYALAARAAIESIPATTLPVVVGGSGLHIRALFDGFSEGLTETPPDIRDELAEELRTRGAEHLYEELWKKDPAAAEYYPDRNPARIVRALEYIRSTGQLFSSVLGAPKRGFEADVKYVVVDVERLKLWDIIEERSRWMMNNGLLTETELALQIPGVTTESQSLATIGYREAIDVLQNGSSIDQAVHQISIATRQYAKRQRTWFRRDTRYVWHTGSTQDILESVLTQLNSESWLLESYFRR